MMRNKVSSWRRQSSRGHWLMYADSRGLKLKYWLAGLYSHLFCAAYEAEVGTSLTLERVALGMWPVVCAGKSVA